MENVVKSYLKSFKHYLAAFIKCSATGGLLFIISLQLLKYMFESLYILAVYSKSSSVLTEIQRHHMAGLSFNMLFCLKILPPRHQYNTKWIIDI